MPHPVTLLSFLAASVILVLIPGSNMVYIVTNSAERDFRAGLLAALGVETASLVHVLAAALGLSAVIAASPVVLTVVRYAGAAYLVFLAIQVIRQRRRGSETAVRPPERSRLRIYADGFLVNLLNPKVILFFLAFLPQFLGPRPGVVRAVSLSVIFVTVALVMDIAYALAGATARRVLLQEGSPVARYRHYVTATVYLGLAGYAALA